MSAAAAASEAAAMILVAPLPPRPAVHTALAVLRRQPFEILRYIVGRPLRLGPYMLFARRDDPATAELSGRLAPDPARPVPVPVPPAQAGTGAASPGAGRHRGPPRATCPSAGHRAALWGGDPGNRRRRAQHDARRGVARGLEADRVVARRRPGALIPHVRYRREEMMDHA
ncbi:hypothetical protein EEJ42_11430 [Streptomyces botrytidirepellens]|uniref:Uncharacterized protein n=1 Tax=Streptomyces botrytidirepellens TaxID=2486417 RepID=A0A3M8WF97_9ACTN|nr:hypothetical protein EEJ42_11430 [Streptomyces botrytidirepellens]